ncbi:MAG: 2Fe-2S iron-sulfur cluster-binding protein, partial [Methylocystaceae bacterium]
MANINLTIDGMQVSVPEGSTLLKAAQEAGIRIPTLCFHPDQAVKANCRVCVVEVEGNRLMQAACAAPAMEGMVVNTNSAQVITARKTILELILSHHPQDCLHCIRNGVCELQDLAAEYNIRQLPFEVKERNLPLDFSTPSLMRDPSKCVLCKRCVDACTVIQTVNALGVEKRGHHAMVVPALGKDLIDSACVMCGQCIHACPVGAINEVEQLDEFLAAVADPDTVVITQIAPAIRVAIAEALGYATG